MPIYDYECEACGYTWESFVSVDETVIDCVNERCGGKAKRLLGVPGVNVANQDSPWIRSVLEVVEKNSGKPHCEEFLKNPTRKNYQNWMKAEGLRHLEPGEKAGRPDGAAIHRKITDEVYDKHRRRNAIEI